jgi:hypothetical protein
MMSQAEREGKKEMKLNRREKAKEACRRDLTRTARAKLNWKEGDGRAFEYISVKPAREKLAVTARTLRPPHAACLWVHLASF